MTQKGKNIYPYTLGNKQRDTMEANDVFPSCSSVWVDMVWYIKPRSCWNFHKKLPPSTHHSGSLLAEWRLLDMLILKRKSKDFHCGPCFVAANFKSVLAWKHLGKASRGKKKNSCYSVERLPLLSHKAFILKLCQGQLFGKKWKALFLELDLSHQFGKKSCPVVCWLQVSYADYVIILDYSEYLSCIISFFFPFTSISALLSLLSWHLRWMFSFYANKCITHKSRWNSFINNQGTWF